MTPSPSAELLDVSRRGDVTVVRFLRRTLLDPLALDAGGDAVAAALRAERPRVLLDFSRVESVASAMVGRLLAFHQHIEAAGGTLAFCGVGPFLAQIFTLCRMPASIATYPDVEAGVAALSAPA